jgi:ubiquitin carboxyl-terminal hydrolase 5/13
LKHHLITAPEVNIDDSLVQQVMEMGFPIEACKKAVYHTKNAGLEPAMQWVMEHMEDSGGKQGPQN